ncbi:hypothetical protein M0R45_026745 [Rubus argutus]
MLYWSGDLEFVIGLDPFIINVDHKNTTTTNYECCFMTIVRVDPAHDIYRGNTQCRVAKGQRMCGLSKLSTYNSTLCWVWELRYEEDDRIVADEAWSKEFNKRRRVQIVGLIGFDPNDDNILYYGVNGEIFEYNIRKRMKSKKKMAAGESINNYCFFPLTVFPWWPTPVPRLPHQLAR